MSVIQGNAIESGLAAYEIPNSLKFNSADSAYLSWTPASAGNRKTWTWSGWLKITAVGTRIFDSGTNSDNWTSIGTNGNGTLYTEHRVGDVTQSALVTTQVFRDPSAWYHIMVVWDTTQATSSNRIKIYVNGTQVTAFSTSNYGSQNTDTYINSTNAHYLGAFNTVSQYFNGYMAEVHFIDGQALDPTSFGEYNSETGVWQPIAYAGTYGTNGFYLPMTQDQIVEGFNTVLFRGNASLNKVTGAGLSPDLVWIKDRFFGSGSDHFLFDSLRGTKSLSSNTTGAETEKSSDGFTSLDADGFTLNGSGGGDNVNRSGSQMVAWCWDAGNSTVSNTDGTITSSVRASQTYGFSVVTYTGTGSNATVGHGLGVAPSMIIVKNRSSTTDWAVYHKSLTSAAYWLELNSTSGQSGPNSVVFNSTAPTSTVFSVGTNDRTNTNNHVAYCFAETGYSKFGSYSGTGTSGNTVTLGFKPAFVMIKRTDSAGDWNIRDNTRSPVNPVGDALYPNLSFAEYDGTETYINMTDTGFELVGNWASSNASGATYIYAAFKDQREAAFWRDFSGNGNHWQPNNLDFNDSVVDTPTNYGTDTGVGGEVRGNYATLNPISTNGFSFTNGNLDCSVTGGTAKVAIGTVGVSSGKWYWEVVGTSGVNLMIGVSDASAAITSSSWTTANGWAYYLNGEKFNNNSGSAYGASYTTSDVIGVALDMDAGTLTFYKNGSSQGTAFSTGFSGKTIVPMIGNGSSSNSQAYTANFGQRPFAYTAPSGFKALCTQNLPEPTVVDGGEYFQAVPYQGNSSTQTISGVGFQPDFTWLKGRSYAGPHKLFDAVRGATKSLSSNLTDAEVTDSDALTAFTSDGFSLGADGDVNRSADGGSHISWNWKANGTGVSNTDGTITSTVSANTTAGFSIGTFSSSLTKPQTIGHGLGAVPAMIIVKRRDSTSSWTVYHKSAGTGHLLLNATDAYSASNYFPSTSSTTFSLNDNSFFGGSSQLFYAFAPVEGYSAFGSYTGNGSSDGPFVYTGFRPRYLMVKVYDSAGNSWWIWDSARNPYNETNILLAANASSADTSPYGCDFLSNGFKLRTTTGQLNGSGLNILYAAFAENPFKYSLAR